MQWTLDKFLECLRQTIHEENYPKISKEELFKRFEVEVFSDERAFDIVEYIRNKFEDQMKIYGSAKDIWIDLRVARESLKFCKYPENEKLYTELYFATTTHVNLPDRKNRYYVSKNDIVLMFHKQSMNFLITMDNVSELFIFNYLMMKSNVMLRELENFYELVSYDNFMVFISKIVNAYPNKFAFIDEEVGYEDFAMLRDRFDNRYENMFEYVMEELGEIMKDPSTSNYDLRASHAKILTVIENIDRICGEFYELLSPFSSSSSHVPSKYQEPVVRMFLQDSLYIFLLKESKDALTVALKRRFPDQSFPDDLLPMESDEDRKLGIVHVVTLGKFREIVQKLGLLHEDIDIIDCEIGRNCCHGSFSIISSYGKPCKELGKFLYDLTFYLSSVLKVLRRGNEKSFKEVYKWIEGLDDIFRNRTYPTFIEVWKCDEIIEKARNDLMKYKPDSIYEIPFKENYSREEVLRELHNLSDKPIKPHVLLICIQTLDCYGPTHPLRSIHSVYNINLQHDLSSNTALIKRFFIEQLKLKDEYGKIPPAHLNGYVPKINLNASKAQPASPKEQPSKQFSSLKKGFLNNNKPSPKKVEKEVPKKEIIVAKEIVDRGIQQFQDIIQSVLAHLSNEEFKPISQLEKVLKQHFRVGFDDETWKHLKTVFQHMPNSESIQKYIEFETEKEVISFKKKKIYDVDEIQIKMLERFEKYELNRLKYVEIEKESEEKSKKIQDLKQQMAENAQKSGIEVEKLRKEMEDLRKVNIEMEERNKLAEKNMRTQITNIKHNYKEEIQKSKDESALKDEKIRQIQEELKEYREDLKNERSKKYDETDQRIKIADENLRKMKSELEHAKLLENAKSKENLELKEVIEQLKIHKEILEKELDEVKSMNTALKIENAGLTLQNEKLFLVEPSPKIKYPQVQRRSEKYLEMLKPQYKANIDSIHSNINRLSQLHPNSIEIVRAKLEILQFTENFDGHLEYVRKELQKIEENPNILVDDLDGEIEEFPSERFMGKYRKWVAQNNL